MKKQIKLKNKSNSLPKYSFGGDLLKFGLNNIEAATLGTLGLDFYKPKYDYDTMGKIDQVSQGISQFTNKAKLAALNFVPGVGPALSAGMGAIQGVGNQISNTQFKRYGGNMYQSGGKVKSSNTQEAVDAYTNEAERLKKLYAKKDQSSDSWLDIPQKTAMMLSGLGYQKPSDFLYAHGLRNIPLHEEAAFIADLVADPLNLIPALKVANLKKGTVGSGSLLKGLHYLDDAANIDEVYNYGKKKASQLNNWLGETTGYKFQSGNEVNTNDMMPYNPNYLDKVSENLIQMDGPSHDRGGIKTPAGEFDKQETVLKKGVVGNPTPFAFSDNLYISPEVQKQLGLPTRLANRTIADASKFIENKYESNYKDDRMKRGTKERMKQSLYTKLMNANKIEFAKNREMNGIQNKEDMSFDELNSQYQSGGIVDTSTEKPGSEILTLSNGAQMSKEMAVKYAMDNGVHKFMKNPSKEALATAGANLYSNRVAGEMRKTNGDTRDLGYNAENPQVTNRTDFQKSNPLVDLGNFQRPGSQMSLQNNETPYINPKANYDDHFQKVKGFNVEEQLKEGNSEEWTPATESPTYKYKGIEYKKVDDEWMWKSNKTGALHKAKNFNDDFIERNNLEPGIDKGYKYTRQKHNITPQKSIQHQSPKLTYGKQSMTSPDYKMYNPILFDNTSTPNLLPDKKSKGVDYGVLREDLETRDNKLLSKQNKYRASQDSKLDLQNYENIMSKLPQDAAEAYSQYRVGNRDNNKGFKILSKANNRMYNFDKNGRLTGDFEVLRGMTKGDFPNTSNVEKSAYANSGVATTPGGKYTLDPSYNTVTQEDLKEFEGRVTSLRDAKGRPINLAVHQTYNPQNRNKFYNNENIEDNRQSFGCINCSKEDYDDIFIKNLRPNDTMYVTKEPKSLRYKYGMEVNKYQSGMELFPKKQTYEWNINSIPQGIPTQYMRNYETRSKVPNMQPINGTNNITNWTNYLDYSQNSPQNFMTEMKRGELSTDFKIPFTGQKGSLYDISDYMPKEDIIDSDMENRARDIKVNTLDVPDITARMNENDKEIKDKQSNFWSDMSSLEKVGLGANALSTLGQGLTMLKKDRVPTQYNNRASQISNIMSDRRINTQPMVNELTAQYNAASNRDNNGRSWNTQRGLNANLYNQYANQLGTLGMKGQEMNNQYKAQYAETLNNLGQQDVQARTYQEELQAKTDAARQNALRGLMANTGENLSNFAFTKDFANKTIEEGTNLLKHISTDFGINAENGQDFIKLITSPNAEFLKIKAEAGGYDGPGALQTMLADIDANNKLSEQEKKDLKLEVLAMPLKKSTAATTTKTK